MLNLYLKRAGVVTGPLPKNTSYSAMSNIKKGLLCQPLFKGGEAFLTFGNALHELFLEGRTTTLQRLSDPEQITVIKMAEKLKAHPVVKSLMANSVREQKIQAKLNGVPVSLILDIKQLQLKRGADLKTTNANTQSDFVKKAVSFGYFNQGLVYKKSTGLKNFYFIAITKEPPYEIFILDVADYPEEEKYAERELEFLLYFYKHYGNFISNPKQISEPNNQVSIMAKTGKDALQEIAAQHKSVVSVSKEVKKAETSLMKERAKLQKLVDKFPAKERELYQEKIDKYAEVLDL